jgi:hypothetical protein
MKLALFILAILLGNPKIVQSRMDDMLNNPHDRHGFTSEDSLCDGAAMLERARAMASESANIMREAFPVQARVRMSLWIEEQCKARADLVLDCFLTGAVEMLRALLGDSGREPWFDDPDHASAEAYYVARINALNRELALKILNAGTVNQQSPDGTPSGSSGE